MIQNPHMLPKLRSSRLIAATHDMPCTLRLAGFVGKRCSDGTMAVHLDRTIGKGMGTKVSDLFVVAGCDTCHRLSDGRDLKGYEALAEHYPAAFMERLLKALAETQARWLDMGLIHVEDGEVIR